MHFYMAEMFSKTEDIIGMEEPLYCWYSRRILGICMSEVLKTGMELGYRLSFMSLCDPVISPQTLNQQVRD